MVSKSILIEAHKYVKISNAATLIHYFMKDHKLSNAAMLIHYFMKDHKLTIICFLYVISLFYERS